MLFADQTAWVAWLAQHHATTRELWLRLAKKGANLRSLSYAEALDAALCSGWIDGQKKSCDSESWLQKFTRRGKRSVWSKVNREHAERLIGTGAMQASGLAAIDAAKRDGRWDRAYDSQRSAAVVEEPQPLRNPVATPDSSKGRDTGAAYRAVHHHVATWGDAAPVAKEFPSDCTIVQVILLL